MRSSKFRFASPPGIAVLALALLIAIGVAAVPSASAQRSEDCYVDVYTVKTFNVPGAPPGTPPVEVRVSDRQLRDECVAINDDRVNRADSYAAAAIYCQSDGVAIWDIDDISRGTFSFLVTYDLIASVATDPAQNQLIAEHGGFRLYRLMSGELQLNSPPDWEGKEYVFTWVGCQPPATTPQ